MKKIAEITYNQQIIKLPLYFPSISSVKTNFNVVDYLKLIDASGFGNFLISAYDIHNQAKEKQIEIIELLKKLKQKSITILMDSGNYESYWHRDDNWNIGLHNEILKLDLANINFSYDIQDVSNLKATDVSKIIIENTQLNKKNTNSMISPIIHASYEDLEFVCTSVVSEIKPKLVAIPERLLGEGIIQRFSKLKLVRQRLNKLGYYTPIHLLGTGSPFSLLVFIWAGADTFDGLEWCQTAINPNNLQTYHFQLREIFDHENHYDDYRLMTLFQNLKFFTNFKNEIHTALETNSFNELLKKYFSKDFLTKLK